MEQQLTKGLEDCSNQDLELAPAIQSEPRALHAQKGFPKQYSFHQRNNSHRGSWVNMRLGRGQKENVIPVDLQGTCPLMSTTPSLKSIKVNKKQEVFKELILAHKGLQKLPRSFISDFSELTMLNLRDNKFIKFPLEILGLTKLRILRLDENFIKCIPSSISRLTELQILTLAKNSIKHLDPSIMKLTELTELSINDNRVLEEWPDWVSTLQKLKLLHIQGNPLIPSIPLSLGYMSNLTELGFDWLRYILLGGKTIARGRNDSKLLHETKCLCRELFKKLKEEETLRLSFKEFIKYFRQGRKFDKERTALHMAAIWNHIGVVSSFSTEDVNIKDNKGYSPLLLAIKYNSIEVVSCLLKNPNTKVSIMSKHGTALHLAINKAYWNICKPLIKHPRFDPNVKDNNGNAVLHLLFNIFEQEKIIVTKLCKELLMHGKCNPNERNAEGLTIVHCAAKRNQMHAIRFILEMNRKHKIFDLHMTGGKQGFTMLHFLVIYSDIELINEVLEAGVNVLAIDNLGRTARDIVKTSIIKRLLLRHEKCLKAQYSNHNEVNFNTSKKYYDTLRLMLQHNINPFIANRAVLFHNHEDIKYKDCYLNYLRNDFTDKDEQRIEDESQTFSQELGYFRYERDEHNGELVTERILAGTLKRPNLIGEHLEFENTLNFKSIFEDNFCYLYGAIVNETVVRSMQYNYVYHIFWEHNKSSEETINLLLDKLVNQSKLKLDLLYLLSFFNRPFNKLFTLKKPKRMSLSFQYELENAKYLVKDYVPIHKNEHILSLTHHKLCKRALGYFNGTEVLTKKSMNTTKVKEIPSFLIRRTMNYFDN